MKDTPHPTENTRPSEIPGPHQKQVESDTLMQGRDQIEILHRGQVYHLRVTRQGKLILTK